MISIEQQQSVLLDIARELKERIVVFAIGGTAMMFHGIKNSTQDIDLVFMNDSERKKFIESAQKLGWTYIDARVIYGERRNIPIMLRLIDERLDLFLEEVIDFIFSDSMKKRAKVRKQFEENLIMCISDPHDIILMKCATDRLKDIDDAKTILQTARIDWNVVIKEAQTQISLGKEKAILELGNFLEKLQKAKVQVPNEFIDKLWRLFEKQVKEKRKKSKQQHR